MDKRIRRSRNQEQAGAARWGGTTHSGSGNGWARKNDVSTRNGTSDRAMLVGDLVEFKDTSNERSIRILVDDLIGVTNHAALSGRRPVLGFSLAGRNYVILTDEDYQEDRLMRETFNNERD